MRHDRTGELVDDDDQGDGRHVCDHGWLDRDADPPQPCLRCRPHLRRRPPAPLPHPDVARTGMAKVRAALAHPSACDEKEKRSW